MLPPDAKAAVHEHGVKMVAHAGITSIAGRENFAPGVLRVPGRSMPPACRVPI